MQPWRMQASNSRVEVEGLDAAATSHSLTYTDTCMCTASSVPLLLTDYQYTWYIISVYSFWYITHFFLYSLFSASSETDRVKVEKGYNIAEILQAVLKGKSV